MFLLFTAKILLCCWCCYFIPFLFTIIESQFSTIYACFFGAIYDALCFYAI